MALDPRSREGGGRDSEIPFGMRPKNGGNREKKVDVGRGHVWRKKDARTRTVIGEDPIG